MIFEAWLESRLTDDYIPLGDAWKAGMKQERLNWSEYQRNI
jgi:hypothetical protein